MGIKFTCDRAKAKRNLQKHGVSFQAAKQVFFDPHLIVVEDCEVNSEMRYHAIGYADSDLLLVVYADRSEEEREVLHIISARKAEEYEQRTYARQFTQGD